MSTLRQVLRSSLISQQLTNHGFTHFQIQLRSVRPHVHGTVSREPVEDRLVRRMPPLRLPRYAARREAALDAIVHVK